MSKFKTSLVFVCFDWFWVFRNFTYKSDFETSKTNYSWWRLFLVKILTFLKSLHETKQAESFLSISINFDACYSFYNRFFQKYFLAHERGAVKNSFSTCVCTKGLHSCVVNCNSEMALYPIVSFEGVYNLQRDLIAFKFISLGKLLALKIRNSCISLPEF